jgi:hypothetical protein
MAISFTDKLRIIAHLCGVYREADFIEAYLEEQNLMKPGPQDRDVDRDTVKSNRENWFFKKMVPREQGRPRKILVGMLQRKAEACARHLGRVEDLLNAHLTTPEFIEKCRVRLPDLEKADVITDDAVNDWQKRYYRMRFMELLTEYEEDEIGQKLLQGMLGTYYLYRRHSVLPGILREVVVVDQHRYAHSEGIYYQYSRTKPWNRIDFNVFYAGFYLLAFGAFRTPIEERIGDKGGERGGSTNRKVRARTEILEIKILIENAVVDGQINCDQTVFPGILTGIYDYGDILLAERILLRRISERTEKLDTMEPKRILPEGKDAAEYRAVVDAVDNNSGGQTLSVRPIHVEKPFLIHELLPKTDQSSAPDGE